MEAQPNAQLPQQPLDFEAEVTLRRTTERLKTELWDDAGLISLCCPALSGEAPLSSPLLATPLDSSSTSTHAGDTRLAGVSQLVKRHRCRARKKSQVNPDQLSAEEPPR